MVRQKWRKCFSEVSFMSGFFTSGNFPCPIYCRTRDKTDEHNTRGREFLETLWRDYAAFLDPDALQLSTQNMPSVFWELYVAHTLNSAGITLSAAGTHKTEQEGPDLFTANPDIWIEAVMPRIVRAFLGVGDPVLHLDRNTYQIVDHSVEHRDAAEKKNRAIMKTDPFLDPAYAHVSAVIYSACNWVSHPEPPGADFTVVHNEKAKVKLPRRWIPEAAEYWRENDQLRSVPRLPPQQADLKTPSLFVVSMLTPFALRVDLPDALLKNRSWARQGSVSYHLIREWRYHAIGE
jgi:hypothetical protein